MQDTTSSAAVSVSGFRMAFGARTVIDGLSFHVGHGETFGFLGSNGSGKTTTIRALLGILQPTGGTLHVNGAPYRPEDGATVGYLPEERGLYRKEPVLDVMTYFGQLKGMPRTAARTWSMDFLDRAGLAAKAKSRLDTLSGGQQQKIQLGVTIMSRPGLLILDEPTKGFDPVNRRFLMDIIAEQKQRGATIILVTHQMDEVEQLCDRILLLKDGAAEAYGTVADVQAQHGGKTARLYFTGVLPGSHLYEVISTASGPVDTAELLLRGPEPDVLRHLIDAGVAVHGFRATRTSLEDVFLRVYGAQTLEGATA